VLGDDSAATISWKSRIQRPFRGGDDLSSCL